ncbi:hypothetical protein AtubIFM55763_009703 [Aspergillus tubingensis]|uniref:Major facilitator superfamily (MFS) profile domain-containing protein n=1 Tax=Aspergillus tubingensis TaxID=5068 RepID=A0A9W6AVF4_ASPTU|nr:hypothetical protein AtubIFM55763_009703 [Aspergillus tubingensis]GLA88653.1 hypothetical protein AtubIFM56815_003112 [Aspergillus tubingensis]
MASKISDIDTTTADHLESTEKKDPYAADPGIEIDEATDKRLFWMITRRILVIQIVTYFFQSLDKGILNYASIMGIKDDAHLVGQEYSLLGTILYIGILVGEYPQNLLLQKFPVAKMLSVNVFIWGAIVACSAASTRFGSLMAVRFLLGFFESCIQPAMMLITAMWYKREEQSVLNSIWYCMTGVQLMIGGLLAFGTSHEEDKKLMVERVRHNETGIENRQFKRYQVIETIQDPIVWCCVMLILVANLVIGGLGVFSNLIIEQFGFSLLQTELLNIAQGSWTIIVMVGSAWCSQRFQQTCLTMIFWTIPAIVGTIVILVVTPTSSNAGGMLIAFYCTQFFLAEGNMIISLITRNTAGQTKKSLTMTFLFVGWAVGNLIAPQIFQNSDAPRYLHGFLAHIVIYAVFIALVVLTRVILMRRNKAKEGESSDVSHELAFQDLTDRENPNFRYVY